MRSASETGLYEKGLYIARFDGLSVEGRATSSMLYLDFATNECSPLWDKTSDFFLARALTVSSCGLFLVMADQASAVSAEEDMRAAKGDEFQTLKMFFIAKGTSLALQTLGASGDEVPIVLRNVVSLTVQGPDSSSPAAVFQPRRIIALQHCGCSDRTACGCDAGTDAPHAWRITSVEAGSLLVEDCVFEHNSASVAGAGIALQDLPLAMQLARFTGITAVSNNAGMFGGGVSMDRSAREVGIDSSSFTSNTALAVSSSSTMSNMEELPRGGGIGSQFSASVRDPSKSQNPKP